MTKTQARRQIHGMRLVAPKSIIAEMIQAARETGVSSWTVLRNRTPEVYDALASALEESR